MIVRWEIIFQIPGRRIGAMFLWKMHGALGTIWIRSIIFYKCVIKSYANIVHNVCIK